MRNQEVGATEPQSGVPLRAPSRCCSMVHGPPAFPPTGESEPGCLPVTVTASWFRVSLLLASSHAFPLGPPSKQCFFLPGLGPNALEPALVLPLATPRPQPPSTPSMPHRDTWATFILCPCVLSQPLPLATPSSSFHSIPTSFASQTTMNPDGHRRPERATRTAFPA